jgi:hypothetical protein
MHTAKSFKPYHGCFGRFQGCLDISAIFNSEEWPEIVNQKGKRMRSKSFARSVALGPSNNQAGTNLRPAHAVPMRHVMSGATKFKFLLLDAHKDKNLWFFIKFANADAEIDWTVRDFYALDENSRK